MPLNDLGTTGLIDYVLSKTAGRSRSMAYTNALKVIRRRHGVEGVRRFKLAEYATWQLRNRSRP